MMKNTKKLKTTEPELYTAAETNSTKFYMIPKELCENKCYRCKLNSDDKIVYALLLDRMHLSKKNNWVNDRNQIFLLYSKEKVSDMLGISERTVYKCFKNLEELGLIKQERQGLNMPNKIYIGKIKYEFNIICKQCNSISANSAGQNMKSLQSNNTEVNKTKVNKTEIIYITFPSDVHPFFFIYNKWFKKFFNKDHMRLREQQYSDLLFWIRDLVEYGIDDEYFEEAVKEHFEALPSNNNGNMLAFMKASKRYFEVDPEDCVKNI
jgi:predicted transcriptional regulator